MQVHDDQELLELMLRDRNDAPDLYKPTNYWLNYENLLLPELRSLGLKDFRRRKNSVLTSFGATDLLPSSMLTHHLSIWKEKRGHSTAKKVLELILQSKALVEALEKIGGVISGATLQDVRLLCYEFAKYYGESRGAKSIRELEASTVGNPEDIFIADGKRYTTSFLNYYIQYAYCSRYVNFDRIDSICEIGGGSGKQIEVIRKLHPNITFYIFDIPPQLYVCQQYLSALFQDSVVSYRETRTMQSAPKDKGRIFIFGNWKLPKLAELKYDLFWNSASFQEMEPDVVLNYLRYANEQTAEFAFLNECMEGMMTASEKGEHGVLERTTLEHYKKGLRNLQLKDMSRSIYLPGLEASAYAPVSRMQFSFWSKNQKLD
jgi:putative sugar O-methyltransferase